MVQPLSYTSTLVAFFCLERGSGPVPAASAFRLPLIQSGAAASVSSIFSVVEAILLLRTARATLAPLSFVASRGAQTSPCDLRCAENMDHLLGHAL